MRFLLHMGWLFSSLLYSVESVPYSRSVVPKSYQTLGCLSDSEEYRTIHIHSLKNSIAVIVAIKSAEGVCRVGLANNMMSRGVQDMVSELKGWLGQSEWTSVECSIIAPGESKKENFGKWVNDFDSKTLVLIRKIEKALRESLAGRINPFIQSFPYIPSKKQPVIFNGGRYGRFTMPHLKMEVKPDNAHWSFYGDGYTQHPLFKKISS